jgi:predicted Zn finger-like uncharacterized protein
MKITCISCQSRFRLDSCLVKATGSRARCSNCQQIFTVFPPDATNRRRHKRIETKNLISHVTVDEHGQAISQGIGETVDISKGGILLETPHPIELGLVVLTTVDLDNNFLEIKGNLVYCRKTATGMYHSGIRFVDTNEQMVNFAVKLIKEYNHRKNDSHDSQAQHPTLVCHVPPLDQ